jgi:hypothetical protein
MTGYLQQAQSTLCITSSAQGESNLMTKHCYTEFQAFILGLVVPMCVGKIENARPP